MNTLAQDFLSSFKGTIRAFPPSFRQVYTQKMEDFRLNPSTEGFDQITTRDGFKDPTLSGVAHRMYWWFPAHFFKFQDALLRWEDKWQKENRVFVLNKPQVTFVDLGCGGGAASIALLSVIEQYQLYLDQHNVRTEPIIVNLIALDPCQTELDIYTTVLNDYLIKLKYRKITANIHTICQSFPQGKQEVIEALSLHRGHTLIVGMSNLINWIWNEADIYWETDTVHTISEVQSEEVDALREITLHSDFDTLYVVGVATQNRTRWWLADKLSAFFRKLVHALRLSKHPYGVTWRIDAEVLFENPESSRWAKDRAQATSRYSVENVVDVDPKFYVDSKLHKALTSNSIEQAWIKTQNYMSYEAFVDRVELKLFEVNYDLEIERIIQVCLERLFQYLNVELDFPYAFPKNNETDRPKSSARLEEQIIAIAIALSFKDEIKGSYPSVSFSFRLAPDKSEFLYEYWFQLYSQYLSSIIESLDNDQICTSDIKSFYTNINQSKLLEILSYRLQASYRCYEMIEGIIQRDCHFEHAIGFGILQGHAVSGLLANVMLQPVDERLINDHAMNRKYFRFADDVTFTGINSTEIAEQVDEIVLFQKVLNDHDQALELNIKKTQKYERPNEFKQKVGGSKEYDEHSARFRKLLLPLFAMNRDYRHEFARINWHFVYEYQKLLEDVGIYFSPEWLYRKLDEYTRQPKLLTSQFKIARGGYSVGFPELSLNSSRQGRSQWAKLFREENNKWVSDKEALSHSLSMMFQSAAKDLLSKKLSDTSWHSRRIKFSLYRLSVFGMGEIANQISELLTSQPWNIPIWLSCRGLARAGLETELFHIISESKSSYVRANALKALGNLRTAESVEILASVLDGDAEFIEKLMASEALLEANFWHGILEARIKTWLHQTREQPYLYKNIILIFGQAYPQSLPEFISSIQGEEIHPIVNRAIHYTKMKPPTENILWRPEPDVFRKYRAKSYPIIEELLQDVGSYKFASR